MFLNTPRKHYFKHTNPTAVGLFGGNFLTRVVHTEACTYEERFTALDRAT